MDIRDKIIEIITLNSDMENVNEYLHNNDDLFKLGMNSISFIKLVVNLESEFDFEFEDEALDYSRFNSLDLLCSYIEEQMRINNVIYTPKDEGEKEITLKDELIQIISKHCEISNHNLSAFNDLSALNLSQISIQSILLDVQNQYGIVLDEILVSNENLFILDNLCNYINKHK